MKDDIAPSDTAGLPIGMFDSGVGGLTVLKALRARLPEEDILYLGDTARLPYGTKSPATITRYAVQSTATLVRRGVKLLVVACNTASAVALDALSAAWPGIPVIGVVEPGAAAACAASKSGSICVLGTASTIRGGAYQRAIERISPGASVTGLPCGLFVSLAEEGWLDGPLVEGIARKYLEPVFFAGSAAEKGHAGSLDSSDPSGPSACPDCLVLGCTHFPLLLAAIDAAVNSGRARPVTIVDSAATTATVVEKELERLGLRRRGGGTVRFLTTDDTARFAETGSLFLGERIAPEHVELVDLETSTPVL